MPKFQWWCTWPHLATRRVSTFFASEYRTAVNIGDTFLFQHITILHRTYFLISYLATVIILGYLPKPMTISELHNPGNSIYIFSFSDRGALVCTQAKNIYISSNKKLVLPYIFWSSGVRNLYCHTSSGRAGSETCTAIHLLDERGQKLVLPYIFWSSGVRNLYFHTSSGRAGSANSDYKKKNSLSVRTDCSISICSSNAIVTEAGRGGKTTFRNCTKLQRERVKTRPGFQYEFVKSNEKKKFKPSNNW